MVPDTETSIGMIFCKAYPGILAWLFCYVNSYVGCASPGYQK